MHCDTFVRHVVGLLKSDLYSSVPRTGISMQKIHQTGA